MRKNFVPHLRNMLGSIVLATIKREWFLFCSSAAMMAFESLVVWDQFCTKNINLSHSLPQQVMKVTDLVQFVKDHQTNNNNDTVLLPQLKIERAEFLKSQIPGILPILEDTMGDYRRRNRNIKCYNLFY